MKTQGIYVPPHLLVHSVRNALAAIFATPLLAFAQDAANEEVMALTRPTNFVEAGAAYISKDSAKFGEYNGLNKEGGAFIGNFGVRGGSAYGEDGGTLRWNIGGTDLGTTSRALGGSVSDQGKWSLGLSYDELRHNITDSYQTPMQGAMGGNKFTLPTTFGVIQTSTPATAPGARTLTSNQLGSFQTQDVHTDRKNTTFNGAYSFDTQWEARFEFKHLDQSGAKLLGVAGEKNLTTAGIATWAGQTPFVLMNPTNYTTDMANLSLNWTGEKNHVSVGYFGSMFRDGYSTLSWMNPFQNTSATGTVPSAFPLNTMSTMPGNDFHQLNMSGGYVLTPTTKLVGGLSYGRNTQNDAYSASGVMTALPQGSLDGLVVNTHADAKLTNQASRNLLLSAGFKLNERDNRTASHAYTWSDINENPGTQTETSINTPMSNKKTQFELAGDYRIDKNQKLRLSYENERINRWCNNALANNAQGSLNAPVTGVAGYTAATCAQVGESRENKLAGTYRVKATEEVSFNAGYAFAKRKSDVSSSYYNPMQSINTPAGTGSQGEGFNVPGFLSFFDASRTEQTAKGGVTWQASEQLSLALNGRYKDSRYDDLTYGVKNGKSWSVNVDLTYSYGEKNALSAYVTTQNMQRDMTNDIKIAATAPGATALSNPANGTWTNKLKENDLTFGFGARHNGLLNDRLDFAGDLTYSLGRTGYSTQLDYAAATSLGATCSDPTQLLCGSLPDIKSEMIQLKLSGVYKIAKSSRFIVGYQYQHLKSNDYFYNAYQYGSTPTTLLPTNQQAPTYNINVFYAVYNYSFN